MLGRSCKPADRTKKPPAVAGFEQEGIKELINIIIRLVRIPIQPSSSSLPVQKRIMTFMVRGGAV
jgi:hypothetical protein